MITTSKFIKAGALVHYRYMSYSPGIILAVDKSTQRLLLNVNHYSEKFTKWVHFNSVELNRFISHDAVDSHQPIRAAV